MVFRGCWQQWLLAASGYRDRHHKEVGSLTYLMQRENLLKFLRVPKALEGSRFCSFAGCKAKSSGCAFKYLSLRGSVF